MQTARVLIIEENVTHRKLLSLLCERFGTVPCAVPDCRAAVQQLKASADCICVFMDMGLPYSQAGQGCVAELRRWRRKSGARFGIVITSAYATLQDKQRSLDLGADDFLSKPFLAKEFEAVVDKWKGRRHQGEAGQMAC